MTVYLLCYEEEIENDAIEDGGDNQHAPEYRFPTFVIEYEHPQPTTDKTAHKSRTMQHDLGYAPAAKLRFHLVITV